MEESAKTVSSGSVKADCSTSFGMRSVIKAIKLKYSSVKNVTTGDLALWLTSSTSTSSTDRSVILLDSRPEEEYVVSHMENSIRVDCDTENIEAIAQICDEKLQDKPQPSIVCYCSVGYRSSLIAEKLQIHYKNAGKQLAPDVFNVEGSLFQWANEGRPMVDSNGQPTIFAHPYSTMWGMLLDKSLRREKT